MDFGEFFGWYSIAEGTTKACQAPCKSINNALIPWHFYLLCAILGGGFIGINAVFFHFFARRFVWRVDGALESFAKIIERVARGLENKPDGEGTVSVEELVDGKIYHPFEIVKAFVYLVDQILERLVAVWDALTQSENSALVEIPSKGPRPEVTIRELLMEREREDMNWADRKRKGGERVQKYEKARENKSRNGRPITAAGMGGSRVSGAGEGSPKDAKGLKIVTRYNSAAGERRINTENIKRTKDHHCARFPTTKQGEPLESPSLMSRHPNTITLLAARARMHERAATSSIAAQLNSGRGLQPKAVVRSGNH